MMNYCVECGCKLEPKMLKNEGEIPFCPQCNQFRFPIYNTAVSMVVVNRDANQILLIQQYGKPFWILVAGYINRGEQAEEAVRREVMEETGLVVDTVSFNRSSFFEPSNTLMLNFTAYVADGQQVKTTDEVDRWQWFSYAEAAEVIKPSSLTRKFLTAWLEDRSTAAPSAEDLQDEFTRIVGTFSHRGFVSWKQAGDFFEYYEPLLQKLEQVYTFAPQKAAALAHDWIKQLRSLDTDDDMFPLDEIHWTLVAVKERNEDDDIDDLCEE